MTTRQIAKIRKEAYNQAYDYDGSVELPEGTERFLELYDAKKAIQKFNETPMQFYTSPNPDAHQPLPKRAKKIALQAALEYIGRDVKVVYGKEEKVAPAGTRLVEMAQTIYEWLTEPVTDKR